MKRGRKLLPMLDVDKRTALALLHDAAAALLAWCFAYLLRFNFELPANFAAELLANPDLGRAARSFYLLAIQFVSRNLALCQHDRFAPNFSCGHAVGGIYTAIVSGCCNWAT